MNAYQKIKLLPDALEGYLFSDPQRNGEYKFLESYIKNNMLVFDVGANTGEYSEYILSLNPNVFIHCFEPVSKTFETLEKKIRCKDSQNIYLNNIGLSDKAEQVEMFIYGENAGSNSIYYSDYHANKSNGITKELVQLTTLDEYINEKKITRIDLLKIDVEGHELNVIKGGINAINVGIVKCLQFEYNYFWKKAGNRIQEMIMVLDEYDYRIYRLTPWGKIRLKKFSPNLENYKHSNYLAISK